MKTQLPFGESIPVGNPHAISVSLPFFQNIIDYEENEPAALAAMQSGYPRFFQNKLVTQLVDFIKFKYQLAINQIILPITSLSAKVILEKLLEFKFKFIESEGCVFLIFEEEDELCQKTKDYIRNIGLIISSRRAESILFKNKQISHLFDEKKLNYQDAKSEILKVLSRGYSNVNSEDILLTNSGMSALFCACETVIQTRKIKQRSVVVQLGWLYIDTMEIVEKRSEILHLQINFYNKRQLENWLETNHKNVAALVTEVITNPLMQCVDLFWLSGLCKRYGIVLIADNTLATPFNVSILEHCDIIIESLTKFASGNADLLMGAIILNDKNEFVKSNRHAFESNLIAPFEGEICRLGFEIQRYEKRVRKIAENSRKFYQYISKQKFVRQVFSIYQPASWENYLKICNDKNVIPGIFSIVFDQNLDEYYDRLLMLKGPSLGTNFTLAMPYVYLAHYQLTKTTEGQKKLQEIGLDKNILRLSIGEEPIDEIIEIFENLKQ